MLIDIPFFAAIGAFGWGLSLATYRMFAQYYRWPMGIWHVNHPALPVVIGLLSLIIGLLFAGARGTELGGWFIILYGLMFALLWVGVMRVGAQLALILAPLAAAVVLTWTGMHMVWLS